MGSGVGVDVGSNVGEGCGVNVGGRVVGMGWVAVASGKAGVVDVHPAAINTVRNRMAIREIVFIASALQSGFFKRDDTPNIFFCQLA